jgi:hypothetical protein
VQCTLKVSRAESNLTVSLQLLLGVLFTYPHSHCLSTVVPPAEKEAWAARGEADKARYLSELANYLPPPGYDAKGDAIISEHAPKGRSGKRERDPNAPKRCMSAYLLYQNAMREQFKRENPGMT